MKKVLEGYLFCKPYVSDAWILLKDNIRKIFTNPNSLRKALALWKTAEKRGYKLVRKMMNERKEELKRCGR